jgi:hypothetical protein
MGRRKLTQEEQQASYARAREKNRIYMAIKRAKARGESADVIADLEAEKQKAAKDKYMPKKRNSYFRAGYKPVKDKPQHLYKTEGKVTYFVLNYEKTLRKTGAD